MKTNNLLLTAGIIVLMVFQAIFSFAQTPQKVSYQMVVRDDTGELVKETTVGVQVSILQGSADGSAVYVETHAPQSNVNGLVSLEVGNGTPTGSTFADIDWANGPYFLKVETDPAGGSSYAMTGISEILSVPYALHAKTADEIKSGNIQGEMLFWDGNQWLAVPPGEYDQTLHICNGIPTWGPCPSTVPVISTNAISEITESTAISGGTIISGGNDIVSTCGLVWDINPMPTINDNLNKTSINYETTTFFNEINELSSETTYYVRAYAINSQGTGYGNQITFTTEAQTVFLATLSTTDISNITTTSAITGGNISNNGGATVSARGIVWDTNCYPTIESNIGITNNGEGNGEFIGQIESLNPNTKYYARAYAINSQGVSYGNQQIFITLKDINLPSVTTTEITNIDLTSATGGGNITPDGGDEVLARGICWGKNESPTLNNFFTEDGNGTGMFTSQMENLETGTTYYVRAFATTATSIAYGNQVEFTTITGLPVVSIIDYTFGEPGINYISGEVTADGGSTITERGFVWNISENPTKDLNDGIFTQNEGLGEYFAELTELTPNTVYYVRAYAVNSQGIAYSTQRPMPFWDYHSTVSDFDGNIYKTVMIGQQEWMAENLKTTSFSNGIPIPHITDNTEWAESITAAYCFYNNDPEIYGETYGALYNFYAVSDSRGLCPTGWHVATESDFEQLISYISLSGFQDYEYYGTYSTGKAFAAQKLWESYSTEGSIGNDLTKNNNSGFSALPGSRRAGTGFSSSGYFLTPISRDGYWWTGLEYNLTDVRIFSLSNSSTTHQWLFHKKDEGLSVRCIKD